VTVARLPRLLRPFAAALLALLFAACSTVEETQRSQYILPIFTDSVMVELGADAYTEATAGFRQVTGTREAQMVERVGQRIAAASGRDYPWQFALFDDPEVVNAFCLPGGKVAVFTGILPVCQDEAGLAVVIGHEVAHATSRHGAERISQELTAQIALGLVAAGIDETEWSDETKAIVVGALALGAQFLVLLPYSRATTSAKPTRSACASRSAPATTHGPRRRCGSAWRRSATRGPPSCRRTPTRRTAPSGCGP